MVDVSESVLNNAKAWLLEASSSWGSEVCKGKAIYLNETKVVPSHTACHSWVSHAFGQQTGSAAKWDAPYKKGAEPFLVLTCYSRERAKRVCSPEASDFLILWMARESPFSQFILNRDDEKSLTEGGAVLLCGPGGLSHPQAMWVCKVLRFITEGGKAADVFMTLVTGGVDPMLALFVASHIRTIKGATFGYTGVDNHSSVFHEKGYNSGKLDLVGLVQRHLNTKAVSTTDVFIRDPEIKVPKKLIALIDPHQRVHSFCEPLKKSDGWGGTINGAGVDKSMLIQRVLEWQEEFGDYIRDDDGSNTVPLPKTEPMPDSSTVYLELDI